MFNGHVMLSERQVFEVIRIEDNAHIVCHYTMKEAMAAAEQFQADWGEECRIARAWISGEETLAQRKANEEV